MSDAKWFRKPTLYLPEEVCRDIARAGAVPAGASVCSIQLPLSSK